MTNILFVPGLELDQEKVIEKVIIKGELPQLQYNFTFSDIYQLSSTLNTCQAYQNIWEEFDHLNTLLWQKLKLRSNFQLPLVQDHTQALQILRTLFDPTCYYTNGLWQKLHLSSIETTNFFQIEQALPFPLRLAPPEKIMHTFLWIDTNIKVNVERITAPYNIPLFAIQQIVSSAFKIYCYLVKKEDYQLARSINFTHSMFLQDRILNLIFGDEIYLNENRLQERGKLANQIALQLLKGLGNLSYRQLCTLSVFMGVIWTSREDTQKAFFTSPESTLGDIDSELDIQRKNWCIDHIDQFIQDMENDETVSVAVVLDDNGESVFDIDLFQRLLNDTVNLRVIFVVNRYPISNNIDLTTFQTLLSDSYFKNLRDHFIQKRARLCVEEQVFRSFELAYLRPETRLVIKQANAVYIKGANFFETFQIPDTIRYHCFTVHDRTSMLLTGCARSSGVFVKLNAGQSGYTYHAHDQIETLRTKVTETVGESCAIQSTVSH